MAGRVLMAVVFIAPNPSKSPLPENAVRFGYVKEPKKSSMANPTAVEVEAKRNHNIMGQRRLVPDTVSILYLDAYFISRTAEEISGCYSVPFYFPWRLVLLSGPIVVVVAFLAAWWPARLAARTNVVAAIGSE